MAVNQIHTYSPICPSARHQLQVFCHPCKVMSDVPARTTRECAQRRTQMQLEREGQKVWHGMKVWVFNAQDHESQFMNHLNLHIRLHILLVCAQILTSWHVTDFLPTCYSSIHIRPHMFSHCPLRESQCHLLSILCIPLQYTHVCASLLEVDRGRGGTCFWFEIRVQAVVVKLNRIPGGILWERAFSTRQDQPSQMQEVLLRACNIYKFKTDVQKSGYKNKRRLFLHRAVSK